MEFDLRVRVTPEEEWAAGSVKGTEQKQAQCFFQVFFRGPQKVAGQWKNMQLVHREGASSVETLFDWGPAW